MLALGVVALSPELGAQTIEGVTNMGHGRLMPPCETRTATSSDSSSHPSGGGPRMD